MPLSDFVDADAAVVSGLGTAGDFHQWALLYEAHHPFLQQALRSVVHNVLSASTATSGPESAAGVIALTGPEAYHTQGVAQVLKMYNCTVSEIEAQQNSIHLLRSDSPCPSLPDSVGRIQFFDTDLLGGRVIFKAEGIEHERHSHGYVHYSVLEEHHSSLFKPVQHVCQQPL